ncbi:MAG: hypothetical protein HOE90_08815 [Bacteriovoracaceae bacterium]|jgi:hypothetical protein|nr:hypothetical protein [Bacteriovoracaceae bacterium]
MKVNIDFDGKEQSTNLTFYHDQFNTDRDYNVAISIVQTFCADFDMDPELEVEDFKEIIIKSGEKESQKFTFIIDEEGIEVDVEGNV